MRDEEVVRYALAAITAATDDAEPAVTKPFGTP